MKPKSAAKPDLALEPDLPKRIRVSKAKARTATQRNRAPWFIAGGVLGLCALVALAVVILHVQTAEGTLVVEINDPDVEARIKNGMLVMVGADGKERYTLSPAEDRNKKIDPGTYTIRVEGADGLELDTHEFTLKKGDKVIVQRHAGPESRCEEERSAEERSRKEPIARPICQRPICPISIPTARRPCGYCLSAAPCASMVNSRISRPRPSCPSGRSG